MLLRTWEMAYESPLASSVVEDRHGRGSREYVDGKSSVGLQGLSDWASAVAVAVGAVCTQRCR